MKDSKVSSFLLDKFVFMVLLSILAFAKYEKAQYRNLSSFYSAVFL